MILCADCFKAGGVLGPRIPDPRYCHICRQLRSNCRQTKDLDFEERIRILRIRGERSLASYLREYEDLA